MKQIEFIEQTCIACPEQYEGRLDTGEWFYVRCRGGFQGIFVGTKKQVDKCDFDDYTATTLFPNDPYKGRFENNELQELFNKANINYESK